MKEKINNILQNIKLRLRRPLVIATVLAIIVAVIGLSAFYSVSKSDSLKAKNKVTTASQPAGNNPLIAVVGEERSSTIDTTMSGNSWPGEIISSELSQIQPQREGVITEWRVRIGDVVDAGDVLGKISAPPATPELISMLAEKTEMLSMAQAGANITKEYADKERTRLDELGESVINASTVGKDASPTTLSRMRERAETKRAGLRSLLEKIVAAHVAEATTLTDWRQITSSVHLHNDLYGALSQQVRNDYVAALLTLIGELKASPNPPIESAKSYFAAAILLADKSITGVDSSVDSFRSMAADDKKEFLEFLADYQESLADATDKETEYALMIGEKKAMLEKDRLMAYAEVKAKQASYDTVANEIKSGLYIIAPRRGTVSAIYKNVGDLVDPAMRIATIARGNSSNLIVRIKIPNNIRKPSVGEGVVVVRPGFPTDRQEAAITGVGAALDESGSYMADATFAEDVDWSAGASVRVIPPESLDAPLIKFSAVWWSQTGVPHVWGVSEASRIFEQKITIGRTIGTMIEVYTGIKNGDRYITDPIPEIKENMFLGDIIKTPPDNHDSAPAKSGGHGDDDGH